METAGEIYSATWRRRRRKLFAAEVVARALALTGVGFGLVLKTRASESTGSWASERSRAN